MRREDRHDPGRRLVWVQEPLESASPCGTLVPGPRNDHRVDRSSLFRGNAAREGDQQYLERRLTGTANGWTSSAFSGENEAAQQILSKKGGDHAAVCHPAHGGKCR